MNVVENTEDSILKKYRNIFVIPGTWLLGYKYVASTIVE